ncbi:hypothetical protein EDD15DRAFT_1606196 [Pisolithus albus]|nr:hypothetical protein EDD15DRAFT_1606196 [Pisolithus albus]
MIVCVTLFTISVDEVQPNLALKMSAYPKLAIKIYIHHASMLGYECLLFSVAFFAALRSHREALGSLPVSWSGVTRLTDILIEGNVVYFFLAMAYTAFSTVSSLDVTLSYRFEKHYLPLRLSM